MPWLTSAAICPMATSLPGEAVMAHAALRHQQGGTCAYLDCRKVSHDCLLQSRIHDRFFSHCQTELPTAAHRDMTAKIYLSMLHRCSGSSVLAEIAAICEPVSGVDSNTQSYMAIRLYAMQARVQSTQ